MPLNAIKMAAGSATEPEASTAETLAPVVSCDGDGAPSVPSVDNDDHFVPQHHCELSTNVFFTNLVLQNDTDSGIDGLSVASVNTVV